MYLQKFNITSVISLQAVSRNLFDPEALPLISTSLISTNIFINFSNITLITTRINTEINKITLCAFVSPLTSSTNHNKLTLHASEPISVNINTDTKSNLFLLDTKIKDSICSSLVTNEDLKLLNNKEKKVAAIIASLENKYSFSAINNNNTSLIDYDIEEKKQPVVITKPLKNMFTLKIVIIIHYLILAWK